MNIITSCIILIAIFISTTTAMAGSKVTGYYQAYVYEIGTDKPVIGAKVFCTTDFYTKYPTEKDGLTKIIAVPNSYAPNKTWNPYGQKERVSVLEMPEYLCQNGDRGDCSVDQILSNDPNNPVVIRIGLRKK